MAANFVRKIPKTMRHHLLKTMSYWPPYFGAGIHVDEISSDFMHAKVSMRLRWFNRNYVNTHFGGSIYSMVDPFYMLMLLQILGNDYIIWDLAARIRFQLPGKGKIWATFDFTEDEVERIRLLSNQKEKFILKKTILVKDESNNIVAKVRKAIYIKKKKRLPSV